MRRELLCLSMVLAVAMTGCDKKPNTIRVLYVGVEQKAILNPQKGDVVTWAKPDGALVPISIVPKDSHICKEDPMVGVCTVIVDNARVLYDCPDTDPCTDPEIVVGSDISPLKYPKDKGLRAAAPPAPVYMYCENDAVKLRPASVTFTTDAVKAGAAITWASLGSPSPDWTVTGLSNPICTEAEPFNKANYVCHLKTDASGPATTYTATIPGCKSPTATGTIYIK